MQDTGSYVVDVRGRHAMTATANEFPKKRARHGQAYIHEASARVQIGNRMVDKRDDNACFLLSEPGEKAPSPRRDRVIELPFVL
jgi:hypothetical protein